MGMYAVEISDNGDLDALRDAARDGRAAARSRRRRVSRATQALNGAGDLHVTGAGAPPPASNGQGAPSGAQGAPGGTPVVTDAAGGRAVSMQRRRQLSQGKQAPNGGADLHVNGAGVPPAASNGQGAPRGAQEAAGGTSVATNGDAARDGRAVSRQRRRQMSQGKQPLNGGADPHVNGAGAPPAASNGQGAPRGAQEAPRGSSVATNGDAALDGRAISRQRRRQMSQGKQPLNGGADPHVNGAGAPPAAENLHVDGAGSGREQARARRAQASRFGGAGVIRPQRQGRVARSPKVIVSPTDGGQRVTGLRIGPGLRVTGDDAGTALPVSGTQYVAADGPARTLSAGPKVGLVRTPQGIVVSGTTVRGKVPITGDEAGEHLPITGEADQKFDDDLTPRSDGTYLSAQFPRRAEPHGASAVGTRLGLQPRMAASSGDGSWLPLENSDGGLAVTGTAVGRSGRVTGNEAGTCRPITGDQYQHLSSYSSECGSIGGGTAPAAHLNRERLDPVTAGKVTVALTWAGQRVTGPNVDHRPNVTGDEPGVCRPVTGTPYQGPSTIFGWCEPDDGVSTAQRLESRPGGVAVTGDVPMHAKEVTGTERGQGNTVTGTPYYRDMRAAEPAGDGWADGQAFPVALARRTAGGEGDDAATQETNNPAPPPSSVPGCITGSFAYGEGKVTGNNEFLFRPRVNRLNGDGMQPVVTGEGRTEGRTVTGSAWTANHLVTGTEGYIAAGRNPSEGGGGPKGWAGARKFRDLATPGAGPRDSVTGLHGWNPKAAAKITLSGGAGGAQG